MTTVTQKNDVDIVVVIKDENGAVVDISGYSVELMFARRRGDTPQITLSVGSGVALTDPTNGELTASLTDVQADLIGTFYYECRVTDGPGNDTTAATGFLTFNRTSKQ